MRHHIPDVESYLRPSGMDTQRRLTLLRALIGVIGVAGLVVLLVDIARHAGGALALPVVLACAPLIIVLTAVYWIDRWEPEPLSVLTVAFLWGAGVATVISATVNFSLAQVISQWSQQVGSTDTVTSIMVAPVVEETAKGLGVLLIYLLGRRTVNGVVDGIVYAAVVAGGFAFGENILYFSRFSDTLLEVFIIRGLMSPFAHVMFTAATGVAVGMAARHRSRWAWAWLTPVGLSVAIILHTVWNVVAGQGTGMYVLIEVPLFVAACIMVVVVRNNERRSLRLRLNEYALAGWMSEDDVALLTSLRGRRRAQILAHKAHRSAAMDQFLRSAIGLAVLRQNIIDGLGQDGDNIYEQELLAQLREARTGLSEVLPHAYARR